MSACAVTSVLIAASSSALAFPASKPAASANHAAPATPGAGAAPRARLVNINTASLDELKTLPGIGDTEAERIVANRPYATKTHLVEKQVLAPDTYDKLRSVIVVEHRRSSSR